MPGSWEAEGRNRVVDLGAGLERRGGGAWRISLKIT
jgi:hypothetical protein